LTLALLTATMLTPPEPARAAPGDALGPEFQVNSFTTDTQLDSAVAMDADGDFVVAWTDYGGQDGSSAGIFAQRFDAAGVAQGGEFQVNTFTTGSQVVPAVAMDADGDFVVAWQSFGQDGSSRGVFAQRYDAAGVGQGGEFLVNTQTSNAQDDPAIAMDADGDFVVAWASFGPDGSDWGIFAQRYDAAGVAQGGEFQVNAFTTGDQELPAVAMDADGDFVVAWRSYGQDGSGYGVFAQRYDAAGVGQGGELLVNTQTSNAQNDPAIAMDADGDFVVAWASEIQDGSSDGIFAQRNQGDGPVAGDFTVDGRSDILWRNTGTGNAILWQMDGFAKEAAGSIGAPSTAWQVRGLADFNADTKTDLLWRNTSTGEAVIWLMDGFTKLAAGGIGAPSLDWQVVGTGDFDGDDHADILWRNITSGVTLIWKMDGLSKTASGGFGGPLLVWEVAGVGDFDADARADILWRNTSTGATVIWRMDGFSRLASGGLGAPALVWEVEDIGEFNSDGRSDILWRSTSTGNTIIWKMNGLTKEAAASIGAPPLVWRVEGVGDGDGDRQSDIIWRNTSNGSTVVWQMDGFIKDAVGGIGNVPLVREVQ
jgi:hypothetical protein